MPPWTNFKVVRVYSAVPDGLLTKVEVLCESLILPLGAL